MKGTAIATPKAFTKHEFSSGCLVIGECSYSSLPLPATEAKEATAPCPLYLYASFLRTLHGWQEQSFDMLQTWQQSVFVHWALK